MTERIGIILVVLTALLIAAPVGAQEEPAVECDENAPTRVCVELDDAIAAKRIQARTFYEKGGEAMTRGDLAEAEEAFNRTIELDPELDDARIKLAEVLLEAPKGERLTAQARAERARQAHDLLLPLLEKHTGWFAPHYVYGRVLERLGQSDKALETFARAAELGPTEARIFHDYARLLVAKDREAGLEAMGKALAAHPDWHRTRFLQGRIHQAGGEHEAAANQFFALAQRAPGKNRTALMLIQAAAESENAQGWAARLTESAKSAADNGALHAAAGGLLLRLDRPDQAEPLLKTALAADHGVQDTHLLLARLHGSREAHAEAIAQLQQLAACDPIQDLELFEMGATFAMEMAMKTAPPQAKEGRGAASGREGDDSVEGMNYTTIAIAFLHRWAIVAQELGHSEEKVAAIRAEILKLHPRYNVAEYDRRGRNER